MSPVPVPGGPFFGPPFPPSPLPPGVRVSPRGLCFPQGPGASRCPNSPPRAFRPASGTGRMPGPGFQASMLPGVRGWCPGIRSTSRTAFMGPVARARISGARASRPAFMLLGGRASSMLSGGKAFRLLPNFTPCFHLSGGFQGLSGGHASPGLPGVRASLNFFLRSICAFFFCFAASRLSVFRRPGARLPSRLPGSMLSGDRGPGVRASRSASFVCYIK